MPNFADAKRRQMARSILPSKARRSARQDRQVVHRSHRRAVNQRLAAFAGHPAGRVDIDLGDLARFPQHRISEIVWDRRAADKVNHFERWAVRSTTRLSVDDRPSYLRSVLPAGLIGDHALSHLRWIDQIVPPGVHDWRYRFPRSRPERIDPAPALATRLRSIIEIGGHGNLNRAIRDAVGLPWDESTGNFVPLRTLAGLHDVDDFAIYVTHQAGGAAHTDAVREALEAAR